MTILYTLLVLLVAVLVTTITSLLPYYIVIHFTVTVYICNFYTKYTNDLLYLYSLLYYKKNEKFINLVSFSTF